MNWVSYTLAAFFLLICIFSGGVLFYGWLTVGIGIEALLFKPLFVFSSIIIFFIPIKHHLFGVEKYFRGVVIWLFAVILMTTILFTYNFLRNRSEDLLKADFYWDAGIELHLRENGTYKVINEDWMSGSVSYGRYKIKGDKVLIHGNLKLGASMLIDTLYLSADSSSLNFKLEEEWKGLTENQMYIRKNLIFR